MRVRFLFVFIVVSVFLIGAVAANAATLRVDPKQAEILKQRELQAPPAIKQKLLQMRANIKRKNLKYMVGFTKALGKPNSALFGDEDDPKATSLQARRLANKRAMELMKFDDKAKADYLVKNPSIVKKYPDFVIKPLVCSNLASFNWQDKGKVTPVKDQQDCGSCWAFAAVGAYEASYLIRNGMTVNGSEQYINDCAVADDGTDAGSCNTGLAVKALQFLILQCMLENTIRAIGIEALAVLAQRFFPGHIDIEDCQAVSDFLAKVFESTGITAVLESAGEFQDGGLMLMICWIIAKFLGVFEVQPLNQDVPQVHLEEVSSSIRMQAGVTQAGEDLIFFKPGPEEGKIIDLLKRMKVKSIQAGDFVQAFQIMNDLRFSRCRTGNQKEDIKCV